MRLTAASLHVLLPPGPPATARAALGSAYRALGFGPSPTDGIAARQAVLAQGEAFLSVYDSACAEADDGTLRALAVHVSLAMQTSVLVTTVHESEDFAFILFHLGRQVDSAVSDPDAHAAGLRAVRGEVQARVWHTALGLAQIATLPHRADDAADPLARFVTIAEAAARAAPPLAEDRLAAWCRLAQLPARVALRSFADAAASPGTMKLALARLGRVRVADPGGTMFSLPPRREDEAYPYHRFYPAAWPVEAGAEAHFIWPVRCRGRGVQRLRLTLHVDRHADRTGEFRVRHVRLAVHAGCRGQIVSAVPLACFGQSVPRDRGVGESEMVFETELALPDPPGRAAADCVILVRVDVTAPLAGDARITPTLRAEAPDPATLILPTLRLAATRPAWAPLVADPYDESPARRQAVLCLNAPAVHTHVAFLADSGQDLRDAVRALLEAWLLPMTDTALQATILTEKHPIADEAPRAARHVVNLAELVQGPLWPRLFLTGRDIQMVRVEIGMPGAPHPLAGCDLMTSLRPGGAPEAMDDGGTLGVAVWAIADPAARALLRLDIGPARAAFAAFVRASSPLQAWVADCAWIPAFDHYESYTVTPYEAAASIEWLRLGLVGTLCGRAWLGRRLRFVARQMWLGWELAGLVDTQGVAAVADVIEYADGVEITLRRAADMTLLERALAKVLPL